MRRMWSCPSCRDYARRFRPRVFLGSSLEQIAGEKAGILKPGVPAVIAPQRPEAEQVITRRAAEVGSRLDCVQTGEILNLKIDAHGSDFDFRGSHVRCPLAGSHQVINAATAVAALQQLGVPSDGIEQAQWPGGRAGIPCARHHSGWRSQPGGRASTRAAHPRVLLREKSVADLRSHAR